MFINTLLILSEHYFEYYWWETTIIEWNYFTSWVMIFSRQFIKTSIQSHQRRKCSQFLECLNGQSFRPTIHNSWRWPCYQDLQCIDGLALSFKLDRRNNKNLKQTFIFRIKMIIGTMGLSLWKQWIGSSSLNLISPLFLE